VDEATRGLAANYGDASLDPLAPWWKPTRKGDRRLWGPIADGDPPIGAGRRMTHPYHEDLVYARTPDRTINLGDDRLRRSEAVLTKTLNGSAVARYDEFDDDVVIREVWLAESLSTLTDMFRHFHRFWMDQLPPDRFIGWQPRDRTWKRYFIEILRVDCGDVDGEFLVEELGQDRPFLMRTQLSVTFKLIRQVASPSGVLIGGGA
jgi:hypothetical protein